ncbi:MAG: acyltransferase, partial [Candidatus Thalassarchaeaceae archaeon]|nr:acyltransferase [Candidatus Thalassarchaeaceae archaeon]
MKTYQFLSGRKGLVKMMTTKSLYSDSSTRRHDIDWLRIILFGLLIWFHFVVFYPYQPEGLLGLPYAFVVAVMHQWRLAALFVISGMGTAFALRRRTWQQYVRERGSRLGIPLIFTIYILFFGIFEFTEKTTLLFTIFPGGDAMPYGHLWFIYNLLIYSIILTPLFHHVKVNPEGSIMRSVRYTMNIRAGLGILILPPIILALNAILFKPWEFGEVGMW